MTFGLNALYGRHKIGKGVYGDVYGGAWNSSNTRSFINYTISKGYRVDSWELGTINETFIPSAWETQASHVFLVLTSIASFALFQEMS